MLITSDRKSKSTKLHRVLLLVMFGLSISATGCSVLKLATERIVDEARFRHTNKTIERKIKKWGEAAFVHYCSQNGIDEPDKDFYRGYRAGFRQAVLQGDSRPPAVIPDRYQSARFASREGKKRLQEWQNGFHLGVVAAEQGNYRDYIVFQITPVAGEIVEQPYYVPPEPVTPTAIIPQTVTPVPPVEVQSIEPSIPPRPDVIISPQKSPKPITPTPPPPLPQGALIIPDVSQGSKKTVPAVVQKQVDRTETTHAQPAVRLVKRTRPQPQETKPVKKEEPIRLGPAKKMPWESQDFESFMRESSNLPEITPFDTTEANTGTTPPPASETKPHIPTVIESPHAGAAITTPVSPKTADASPGVDEVAPNQTNTNTGIMISSESFDARVLPPLPDQELPIITSKRDKSHAPILTDLKPVEQHAPMHLPVVTHGPGLREVPLRMAQSTDGVAEAGRAKVKTLYDLPPVEIAPGELTVDEWVSTYDELVVPQWTDDIADSNEE